MEEKKDQKSSFAENSNFSKPVATVAISVALVFGFPAFAVVFLSQKLEWSGEKTALFMVLAFFFSWAIMIMRFKKLTKGFEDAVAKNKNSVINLENKK